MIVNEYKAGREFVGRLDYGSDLFLSLLSLVREKDIETGVVEVIGACKKSVVAIYDQDKKVYHNVALEGPLEILSCTGNISKIDGKPALHLHIVLSNHEGSAFGGHVVEGTEVFAGEFYIRELLGPTLERKRDEVTGLNLWG
ncbi:PPC domain-containing DNA-binding protein [Thermosediminibacter litoriperuensis]|uniref:PPC domain-containing protein n=1 Tax=Thermosediminibacter litoriperuensis TaxID=291989 RepID=A0A5S5AG83_9FIRM|nr:DUF296 domain-containing protein [Thermosediminibacter litoriperuensis]TYP49273.1 hypothetical protein LZ11_02160 [Thermosediminibacter litoriperuensis]